MADRPILFSGPMVRALIDGRKTQTRRIVKMPAWGPSNWDASDFRLRDEVLQAQEIFGGAWRDVPPRFAKGDRLWVREAWRCNSWATDVATIFYRASESDGYTAMCEQYPVADHKPLRVTSGWRPGIHMPRWASRLTLTVTDVRVQRLTDIDEIDAMAEGIIRHAATAEDDAEFLAVEGGDIYSSAVDAYEALWNRINGAMAWAANPWVVAVTFTVDRRNIDA